MLLSIGIIINSSSCCLKACHVLGAVSMLAFETAQRLTDKRSKSSPVTTIPITVANNVGAASSQDWVRAG